MDVFAIEKGKALELSADEFEKQTYHEYPYYRTRKDKRLSLYALCPECGNPIQIVNMYGNEMMQQAWELGYGLKINYNKLRNLLSKEPDSRAMEILQFQLERYEKVLRDDIV